MTEVRFDYDDESQVRRTASDSRDGEGIPLLAMANLVLRQRALVLGLPLLAFVATVLLTASPGRQFISESKFVAENSSSSGTRATGLAAQLGLVTQAGPSDQSPQFYRWLLSSKDLLRQAATASYEVDTGDPELGTLSGTLPELYVSAGLLQEPSIDGAVGLLQKGVEVSIEGATGFLVLKAKAPWPDLAVQINRGLLDRMHEFNLQRRRQQVAIERQFIEDRMGVAQAELERTEEQLQAFLENNRSFEAFSPIAFRARQLERRVDLRKEVFLSLAQSYEQMRIEEARNTPLITIVERPENSVQAEVAQRRNPFLNGLIALIATLVFALGIAFVREFLRRQPQQNPADFREFQQLSREAVEDLRPSRLLVRIRRLKNGGPSEQAAREVLAGVSEEREESER